MRVAGLGFGVHSCEVRVDELAGTAGSRNWTDSSKNDDLAAGLAAGFVGLCLHAKSPFDIGKIPFVQISSDGFGAPSPHSNIDKGSVLALFPCLGGEGAVHGQAELGTGSSFGGMMDLGLAGEAADEHDFVEAGHRRDGSWGLENSEIGAIIVFVSITAEDGADG